MSQGAASSEPRLYLSHIDSDFVAGRDVALGPWCYIGHEDDNWDELCFIDAFTSPNDVAVAVALCHDMLRKAVTDVSVTLNARHGVNEPFEYWWTLSARWLNHLITAVWRRWIQVEQFIASRGDEPWHVTLAEMQIQPWNFADTDTFCQRGLLSARFDHWLWSLCVEAQAPDHWVLSREDQAELEPTVLSSPPHRTNRLRQFLRRYIRRLPFSDVPDASAWALGLFSILIYVLPRHGRGVFRFKPLAAWPGAAPAPFIQLLQRLMEETMPGTLAGNYSTYRDTALSYRYVPGRLFVNGSATVNDYANFQIAHALVSGEKIVRVQHGSDYGTMAYVNIEATSEYTNHGFLTWGWRMQNGLQNGFESVADPGLSRIANRHQPESDQIILVGTKMILRSFRIDHAPQPTQVVKYRRDKVRFIKALDDKATKALLYRGYGRGRADLSDAAYVCAQVPGLPTLDGDLESALMTCRLLILDHPGTTLNLAMAGNIPTIAFWRPDAWAYAPEAVAAFQALEDAGILFRDPLAAAAQVSAVQGDVQRWWSSVPVQSARHVWAKNYAYTAKVWWWSWLMALLRLNRR